MEFISNIEKDEYEKFVKNHKTKSHFLQSYLWGQFCKESKNEKPYYVGVKDGKKLIATALLLETKLPFGYTKYYSPRGFVLDYSNLELLTFFTIELKKFLKDKKAISFKIDPDIIWNKIDKDNNVIDLNNDHEKIFNHLKKLGYKHLGFTKNFETMQPRYTFRIDLDKDFSLIENSLSKTTKQRINKANQLSAHVRIGDKNDIKEFNHLMELTESRKDFISHDLKYYKKLYEMFSKEDNIHIFIGNIICSDVIKIYEDEKNEILEKLKPLKELENISKSNQTKINEFEMRLSKLDEYIDEYIKAKEKYGDSITLSSHVIVEYGDKAWNLYAGNHNILTSSFVNYKTYFEHIKYCHDKGIKVYDQFGTIGDLDKNNPRYGLHLFKKTFGGDYIEFMGEFDYIIRKNTYYIFMFLINVRRKLLKIKNKIKNKIRKK